MWLGSSRNIVAFRFAYRRTVIPVSLCVSLRRMSRYSVTPGSAVVNLAGSECSLTNRTSARANAGENGSSTV
jgi:hypothetical protein